MTQDADDATSQTDRTRSLSRRRALAGAAAGAASLAGCTGGNGDETTGETPTTTGSDDETPTTTGSDDTAAPALVSVEDPPAAVYVPTHFESVRGLDPVRAGDVEFVPMVTYPHRFWTVSGEEAVETVPDDGEDVHLMVTVRDPETGTVLPVDSGVELTIRRAGESGPGSTHAPWPMLSQEMGFHFGDNVPLGPDGTYEVDVRVGALGAETTGAFAGRFDEPASASFAFEFDQSFRDEVVAGIDYLDEDEWGRRGALANQMAGGDDGDPRADGADHRGRERWLAELAGRRYGTYRRPAGATELPPASDLPGTLQGTPTTGDAVVAVTLLGPDSRLAADRYLAVSPRTPYNRSMLPLSALGYEQTRDGERLTGGDLRPALDPELGYHYAATLADVAAGDALSVAFETPPQASRHAGYETAFLGSGTVRVTLDP
jgi:hypothetical protein